MYNVTIFDPKGKDCHPRHTVIEELDGLQVGQLQTALVRHNMRHYITDIGPEAEAEEIIRIRDKREE